MITFPISAGATHSWGGYHWARTSNPFTVKLGDNVSGLWDSMLVTASNDWSHSNVLDTQIVAGGTRPKSCRPTAGRVEVCNANYRNTGWLGIAQIWITDGTHITQGTEWSIAQHVHALLSQYECFGHQEYAPEPA